MSKVGSFLKKIAGGPALSIASSVLGGVGGLIGASKAIKQGRKQISSLEDQREQALGRFGDIRDVVTTGYEDYLSRLQGLPTLEIDRSLADRALEQSRERMIGAGGGRVAGEELLREEARRTTANQIEAARAAVGDGAGLLGAISLAGMSEAGRMREIDIQTQRQRERELLQAQSAYERGLITRSQFERQADLAEFTAESRKQRDIARGELSFAERQGQLGFQEMGIEKEFDQAIAAQRAAIQQAKASRAQSIFGMISGGVGAFADYKRDQQIMERFAPSQMNQSVDLGNMTQKTLESLPLPSSLPFPQLQMRSMINYNPTMDYNLQRQNPLFPFINVNQNQNFTGLQPRSLMDLFTLPSQSEQIQSYMSGNTKFGN